MAEFAGAVAASHGPLIIRNWHAVPPAMQARMTAAFRALGERLAQAKPDVLVVISPDHWSNFFIDNVPAICVGVGAEHEGPPEPFMQAFPHRVLQGQPAFAAHLVATAFRAGFEPSVSHRLKLDHGFCIPLWRMELARMPALVPIVLNAIEAPMPTIARCLAFGRVLRKAIESWPEPLRVALLATGGLSHSIGERTMGAIDEALDREFIELFRNADEGRLVEVIETKLAGAGNGTHEVRSWVAAHGAAESRGFELVDYLPLPEVIVGCGFANWRTAAGRASA